MTDNVFQGTSRYEVNLFYGWLNSLKKLWVRIKVDFSIKQLTLNFIIFVWKFFIGEDG